MATALIGVTCKFIYRNPQIFLIPVGFSLIIAIWILVWIVTYIFIYSVGTLEKRAGSPMAAIQWTQFTRYVVWYDIFGLLWVNAFLIGSCQFIIACAAATWYFSHSSDTGGKASIHKGIFWLFRYHLGSIAFGSMIIAITQAIKLVFEYYRRTMTGATFTNPIM